MSFALSRVLIANDINVFVNTNFIFKQYFFFTLLMHLYLLLFQCSSISSNIKQLSIIIKHMYPCSFSIIFLDYPPIFILINCFDFLSLFFFNFFH